MQLWTFLHIISMFGAVTVVLGSDVWRATAIRSRDLGSLRANYRIAGRAEAVGGVLLVAGIIFGLIAAVTIGFDLLQGWLVAAYILVALTLVGGMATMGYSKRLKAALDANEGDDPSPELATLLSSPVGPALAVFDIVIIGVIIYDMVFKPF